MKIALIGGTHGNEPVGLEVMRFFEKNQQGFKNPFQCFWGNPKAYELKKRYVDSDLNRAFGPTANPKGYEKERAADLKKLIDSSFDFAIDLHTTTSNMGLTAIINNTDIRTRRAAHYLTQKIPGMKIILEDKLDADCTHLNRLCPASLTIEVGPVANNVLKAELILATQNIVESLLNFDFNDQFDGKSFEVYKMIGMQNFPSPDWYVHPELEGRDFKPLRSGQPIFINQQSQHQAWQGDEVYPFFINEAAYLENRSAFLIAIKDKLLI